jgi:hypothetical protein
MIVAGLITAILLIVIGSAMDKRERAQREEFWRKYRREVHDE